MDLYGIGDHGADPRGHSRRGISLGAAGTRDAEDRVRARRRAISRCSNIRLAPDSPEWNYQSIAKGYTPPPAVAGKVNIPTWKSELYFEYHRGVMTTQANHKRNMREAEVEVLNAEKWASLAWLDGRAYPGKELTETGRSLVQPVSRLSGQAPASARSIRTRRRITMWCAGRRMRFLPGRWRDVIDQIDTRFETT